MHTNYIIPVNFTDAGKLLGTFPVRNSIEALCLLVPVALICLNLSGLSFTVRLMLTVGTPLLSAASHWSASTTIHCRSFYPRGCTGGAGRR